MLNKNELNFLSRNHLSTKRNYIKRMNDNKIMCMKEAKKYGKNYWDGKRKYGYGGYKFIEGRWSNVAQKIVKKFNLNQNSKILDVGCGKGFLLYEIKKIIPDCKIVGFDISNYAIKHSKKEVRSFLFTHDMKNKFPFKKNYFDLTLSFACLHNLEINDLEFSLKEISRVSKKSYIMVESYRNETELFNLQCWALTCESFFSKKEWIWIFKKFGYNQFYEFIYFS